MEKIIHADLFIAGAGASGMAAAYAAAEAGMNVCLAERNVYPGGRATASAVGTICGLYLRSHSAPEFVMGGFPKQFAERLMQINGRNAVKFAEGLWFLPAHPNDFEKAAHSFLSHGKINLMYNTTVEGVESADGKITAVHAISANEKVKIVPQCVIDCSGEGIVCKTVDHEIIRDEEYQAAAIVFSMKNIQVADEFQLSYSLLKQITKHVESGNRPEHYKLLSLIPNSLASSSVLLKMGLPWKVGEEIIPAPEAQAHELVNELAVFIRENISGFEHSELEWIAREVGVRTGIRVKGKQTLADEDVLSCRKTEDSICNGAWPVEYWRTGNKRVLMTYFSEKDFYSIPAGCLQSNEKENLFFAGKIISASENAIASARVIGTCFGTGYAAGILAAYKIMNKSESSAIEFIRRKMNSIK